MHACVLSDLDEVHPDSRASTSSRKNASYKKPSHSTTNSASNQNGFAFRNHDSKVASNPASTDRRNTSRRKSSPSTNKTPTLARQSSHIYKLSTAEPNFAATNRSSLTTNSSTAHKSLPSSPSRQSYKSSRGSRLSPSRLLPRTRSLPGNLDISEGSSSFSDTPFASHLNTTHSNSEAALASASKLPTSADGFQQGSKVDLTKNEPLPVSASKPFSLGVGLQQSSKADLIMTRSLPPSVPEPRASIDDRQQSSCSPIDQQQSSCSPIDVSPVRIVKPTAPNRQKVHGKSKPSGTSSLTLPQLEEDIVCITDHFDDPHSRSVMHSIHTTNPQQIRKRPDKELDTSVRKRSQNPSSGSSNTDRIDNAPPSVNPHVPQPQGFRHGRASSLSHITLLERAQYSLSATLHLLSYPKARQDPVISSEMRMLHEQVIECTQSSMKLLNLTQVPSI